MPSDWSEAPAHLPEVVLRPRTIDDLSSMLSLPNKAASVLSHKGAHRPCWWGDTPTIRMGLVNERMTKMLDIDPIGKTITVEAGMPACNLSKRPPQIHDLVFPLDLGARGTATAGGITSTNAGGNQVIQYGVTRQLILGMTAVLPDGRIMAQS